MSETPFDPEDVEYAWQSLEGKVVYDFGVDVAALCKTNPWPENIDALEYIMIHLATEFWDHYISQTEIIHSFESAIEELKKYAAGQERRP